MYVGKKEQILYQKTIFINFCACQIKILQIRNFVKKINFFLYRLIHEETKYKSILLVA